MAITQTRMLALIAAAADYQQGYNTAIDCIKSAVKAADSGDMSPADALTTLLITIKELAPVKVESAVQISLEQQHFKYMAKKNDYSREYMRHRRVQQLILGETAVRVGTRKRHHIQTPAEAQAAAREHFEMDTTTVNFDAEPGKDATEFAPPAEPKDVIEI